MNYKDYSITNFSKWGWFEAFNLQDAEEPVIRHKLEYKIKIKIDDIINLKNK